MIKIKNKKKSRHKIIWKLIVILILIIVLIFIFIKPYQNSIEKGQFVSPHILYLTQPVILFTGNVEKVEGNIITISQKILEQSPNEPSITPIVKTLAYKVHVSKKTVISQPSAYVNYLFISPIPASQTILSIKDIKKGQIITTYTNTDLRTLSDNEFEATVMNLPPKTNFLNGKITNIDNGFIMIKAFIPIINIDPQPLRPQQPQMKEYRIAINNKTEISRYVYTSLKPNKPSPISEKLTLKDLKKDVEVNVFTAEDVIESQKLTALRIEPINSIKQ